MGSQEAFYVAWETGIGEAVKSRKSLKKHNPDLKAMIVRAEELDMQLSDDNFERKVEMIEYYLSVTDANRILFLDADTEIFGSVQPIFDALDYSDLAMAMAPAAMTNKGVPNSIATYNTGVIGFGVGSFSIVGDWLKLTCSEGNDQRAMRLLLHYSDIKVTTLLPRYNFRPKFPVYLSDKPIIIHTHAGRNIKKLSKLGKGLWKGD